jgi:hypothetical protein
MCDTVARFLQLNELGVHEAVNHMHSGFSFVLENGQRIDLDGASDEDAHPSSFRAGTVRVYQGHTLTRSATVHTTDQLEAVLHRTLDTALRLRAQRTHLEAMANVQTMANTMIERDANVLRPIVEMHLAEHAFFGVDEDTTSVVESALISAVHAHMRRLRSHADDLTSGMKRTRI